MSKNKQDASLAVLVSCALLAALSIVLGKYLAIRVGDTMRFSFENLPILLAGMAFGAVPGVLVAVGADLIGCLLVGYPVNPLVTLGGAVIGLLGAVLFRVFAKAPNVVKVTATVLLAHFVGSVLIKTVGLSAFYSYPLWELMLWRLLNYAVVGAAESVLLYVILKNRAIQNQIGMIRR